MTAASPRLTARIVGICYLLTFLTGAIAQALIPGSLVVAGDAAATATNILTHEMVYQSGIAAYLLVIVWYIAITALFYDLFRPVNRNLALLAAYFSLVGCALQALSCVFLLAPLALLAGGQYLRVFTSEQLRALAYMFLRLYGQGYNIGLIFFGCYCLLIGILIFRSTFLPRILGVLMALAGLGWLTFLSPPLATALVPYNLVLGILAEGSLALWLLVAGVNVQHWQEQAGKAGGRA